MSLKLSFRIISMRAEEGFACITIRESWVPPSATDAKQANPQGPPVVLEVPVDHELMSQLRVGQHFSLEPGPLPAQEAKPMVDGWTFGLAERDAEQAQVEVRRFVQSNYPGYRTP